MTNKCSLLRKGWKSVGNVRYRKPLCDVNAGANALHVTLQLHLCSYRSQDSPHQKLNPFESLRRRETRGYGKTWTLHHKWIKWRLVFASTSRSCSDFFFSFLASQNQPSRMHNSCRSTFLCQSRVDQKVHSIICYFLCKPLWSKTKIVPPPEVLSQGDFTSTLWNSVTFLLKRFELVEEQTLRSEPNLMTVWVDPNN